MLYIFEWKVMTFTSIKFFFIFSHCYIFEETEVQAPGQHPDKGYSEDNMDHLAPGVFQTGEGNFTNHAEGTLNMAICTCLPQMESEKGKTQILWPVQTACICNGRQLTSWSHILFHYLLFHILPSIHHLQRKFPKGWPILSAEVTLTSKVLRL